MNRSESSRSGTGGHPASVPIGAHVPSADPLAEAAERDADCVQMFLSNPQSWKAPSPRPDAEQLCAADLPLYVHAPYLVNVASPDNRVRIPSRRILAETCQAAADVGAVGVVVHGGHVTGHDGDVSEGLANWRKALERVETDVPILIENTAGGLNAVARSAETIERLWEVLEGLEVGFCFDTCHAHAAGEDPVAMAERLRATLGGIDLVHANDSKDPAGSGRDRHEALGAGTIGEEALVEAMTICAAPVVCETPGDAAAQAQDVAWLRRRLSRGPA